MYLTHLDDTMYTKAIVHCENDISALTIPPFEYLVPAIAGTITQLVPTKNKTSASIHTTDDNSPLFSSFPTHDFCQVKQDSDYDSDE